jgi:arylsulfatase A-like enzyme
VTPGRGPDTTPRPLGPLTTDPDTALRTVVLAELFLVRASGGPLHWLDLLLAWGAWRGWSLACRARGVTHTVYLLPIPVLLAHMLWMPAVHTLGSLLGTVLTANMVGSASWAMYRAASPVLSTAGVLLIATLLAGTPPTAMAACLLGLVLVQRWWRFSDLLLLALLVRPPAAGAPDRTDILLITVDALRHDDAMEVRRRLGARGIDTTAWTTAPWTLPALTSLWTGLPAHLHGAGRSGNGFTPMAQDLPSLPERLGDAGYTTVALSGGNVFTGQPYGLLRGFDVVVHPWAPTAAPVPRARRPHGPPRPLIARGLPPSRAHHTAALVDQAAAWLDAPGATFVWLHLMDVHLPYAATPCRPAILGAPHARQRMLEDPWWDTPAGHACFRAGHDAAVDEVDEHLSRLLERVDLDKTLVMLTADHGESLGEDGLEHGHTLHPSVTRIPLAVGGSGAPTTPPDIDIDLLDLHATLLATAGLGTEGPGRDLAGDMSPRPVQIGAPMYLESAHAVVDDGWMLRVEDGRRQLTPTRDDAPPVAPEMALPTQQTPSSPTHAPSGDEAQLLEALGYQTP